MTAEPEVQKLLDAIREFGEERELTPEEAQDLRAAMARNTSKVLAMRLPPRLRPGDKENFATLREAFDNNDVALVSAIRKEDGKAVALVCAMNREIPEGETEMHYMPVPLAVMIEGSPYELFYDPTADTVEKIRECEEALQEELDAE